MGMEPVAHTQHGSTYLVVPYSILPCFIVLITPSIYSRSSFFYFTIVPVFLPTHSLIKLLDTSVLWTPQLLVARLFEPSMDITKGVRNSHEKTLQHPLDSTGCYFFDELPCS